MNNFLLAFLILVSLLALYWILFGQWKHNDRMREIELKRIETEAKKKK